VDFDLTIGHYHSFDNLVFELNNFITSGSRKAYRVGTIEISKTMAEIKFTGNKYLKSIANEFTDKFPYLWLRFYDQSGKASKWDVTHASIRGKKAAAELATTGSMHVGTFEKRYEDAYGVKIEVMYTKNDRNYRSLDEDDKVSLTAYNKKVEGLGAQKAKEAHAKSF
jgi:hypothetical protein